MFEIIFIIALAGYFVQSVLFIAGTKRKFPRISEEDFPSATVIVAARNEEENILKCMQSLDKLIYPEGKLEIILVDDKSSDRTGEIIDKFIAESEGRSKRFKKINTKKEIGKLKGKTNALANAVEIAAGEIVLTTDADCEAEPYWAYTTASYYQPNVGIVNGFTTQQAYSGFAGMQSIDFIYLLTVASGTINLGKPISCIGNNMSYRKKAYEEVGGYKSLPFSVTEDFNLLNAINKLKKYKIIYPLTSQTLITSLPCKNIKELYHQKKRWTVGGLGVPIAGYIIMVYGFLTNLCVLLTPLFFSITWLYLVIFKIVVDFFLMYFVHKDLGISKNLKYFFYFEIYYTLYVVLIPFILTFLNHKVVWKGREY